MGAYLTLVRAVFLGPHEGLQAQYAHQGLYQLVVHNMP